MFAFVMRSLQVVCIDIDGKNGGIESAKQLGNLPRTLAEISKSGTGYHLFYRVDDEWSDKEGFALLSDVISIVPGVDFRATGCVYHNQNQLWNEEEIAPLPEWFQKRLTDRKRQRELSVTVIKQTLNEGDEMEVLLMQTNLTDELNKPIPAGRRNNTLFAIGNQMREAGVENWQDLIEKRGNEIGLGSDEIFQIIANVGKQGA